MTIHVATERHVVPVDPEVPMLTQNASVVLRSRYLDRKGGEVVETPAGLFRRVANAVSLAESSDVRQEMSDRFYDLMTSGQFMPNSPTLMNAGRRLGMLSACFVLPVPDDTQGIFKSICDTAVIQKAGGGTGFAFDELRPCGSYVKSSGGRSSGPISFWRVFCEATNAIQQGSFRRGANMAMMRIDHPDIIKFLHAKQDLSQFTNYNISVKVSDKWMGLVRDYPDTPHVVRWEDQAWLIPRQLVNRCQQIVADAAEHKVVGGKLVQARDLDICYGVDEMVPAESVYGGCDNPKNQIEAAEGRDLLTVKDVMDIIVSNAWKTGEPGMCFIDRIRDTEVFPDTAPINATNPCGEEPLPPWASCNLGSVNLGSFVTPFYKKQRRLPSGDDERDTFVDWSGLRSAVTLAVRFLDDVVTVNKYPTQEIEDQARNDRRIGLGIMGFADALIRLGVRYDSEDGLRWGERFMKFVSDSAISASQELAIEREVFPWFDRNRRWKKPMRNSCVTTIAPTGTISIIANCSGGIEPLFSFAFMRKVLSGEQLMEYHSDFQAIAKLWDFDCDELLDDIFQRGSIQHREDVPDSAKEIFRSARDISPEFHVRMQGVLQKHVTSAVSKTINMPHEATVADVCKSYMLASECGCKGVTVYRDGCRSMQPMSLKSEPAVSEVQPADFRDPVDLPDAMVAIKTRYRSTYGTVHVNVTMEVAPDGRLREREVFFDIGRSGELQHANTESYGRLGSFILRLDGKIESVIHGLRGHGSSMEARNKQTGALTSLPNELAMALLKYYEATQDVRDDDGFLTRIPDLRGRRARAKSKIVKPVTGNNGKGNGHEVRTSDFVRRVLADSTRTGTFRAPCPTPGCNGEMAHGEGCCKCTVCGAGSC